MLPKINNKSFLECTAEDLQVLIDNPDFRENEYIDYKENFAFLEIPSDKKGLIASKISEFKNDVCSFANTDSGYLIFGISDVDGCASELVGIDIENTDKFELDRRNNLASIQPRVPYIKFHFIKLDTGKYIVIIYVKSDSFKPYTHIVNESSYPMYKRSGNGKRVMTYTEIKNMFNQSLSLDKEIYKFRTERIEYYKSQAEAENDDYSRFMLLHIIPETFLDSSYNINAYVVNRKYGEKLNKIFSNLKCGDIQIPCVDGVKIISKHSDNSGYIFNNGIFEGFVALKNEIITNLLERQMGFLDYSTSVWRLSNAMLEGYSDKMAEIGAETVAYFCVSIVGCKNVVCGKLPLGPRINESTIDRHILLCSPIPVEDSNENDFRKTQKRLYVELLLSLGITADKSLDEYIGELYNT